MTAPATIRQDDVQRVVAGAVRGGMTVTEVVVDLHARTIRLSSTAPTRPAANPWDTDDDQAAPLAPRQRL